MYYPRTLEERLRQASQEFKVLLLTGMRQVGKTTCLKQLMESGRRYVTLDHPQDRLLAKTEPALFWQRYPPPVLVDEIQYAPELFPYLKLLVDASEERGQCWLTGSQSYLLMQGVTESLAGRLAILEMAGLSLHEQQSLARQHRPFVPELLPPPPVLPALSLEELYARIWRGSFPAFTLGQRKVTESYWTTFYSSYVQSYLERDVRQLKSIGNEASFLKFLRLVAARTAQVLNLAGLARDAAIAPNTAKSWLSILRASHVIHLLPPYHRNAAKRWIKSPKLFFSDTGLCCYLLGLSSPQSLLGGSFSGALLETFVIDEIRKSYLHNGREPPLFFYRDAKAREIDLLIERDQRLHPVEIKQTSHPQRSDIRAFDVLWEKGQNRATGALLCLTDSPRPLSAHDLSLPIWAL